MSRHPVYAGIGSEATPPPICAIMSDIAEELAQKGWTLRSGGCEGADTAFHKGALRVPAHVGPREIFLPWSGFGPDKLPFTHEDTVNPPPDRWTLAENIAVEFHPIREGILRKRGLRKLMARNSFQVLGADLDDPVDLVLCWTPDGARTETRPTTGGTGQAIRIANAPRYGIPVFNLWHDNERERLAQAIQSMNLPGPAPQQELAPTLTGLQP